MNEVSKPIIPRLTVCVGARVVGMSGFWVMSYVSTTDAGAIDHHIDPHDTGTPKVLCGSSEKSRSNPLTAPPINSNAVDRDNFPKPVVSNIVGAERAGAPLQQWLGNADIP